jgi:hypothetical protein
MSMVYSSDWLSFRGCPSGNAVMTRLFPEPTSLIPTPDPTQEERLADERRSRIDPC